MKTIPTVGDMSIPVNAGCGPLWNSLPGGATLSSNVFINGKNVILNGAWSNSQFVVVCPGPNVLKTIGRIIGSQSNIIINGTTAIVTDDLIIGDYGPVGKVPQSSQNVFVGG